jgi:uncharacterized Zn finger protein
MPRRAAEVPEAAVLPCPDCGEEQVHDVLSASAGEATVRCRECGRVHKAALKPAKRVDLPIIISRGQASERASVTLLEDEPVAVEDEFVAAGQQVQVRAIDRLDGKRVASAVARDVATLWAIHFEEIMVKVAVNMGKKTISKSVPVGPRDTFTVGDEFDLDRLRIYIHAIKTPTGTLYRGTAEAKDITRIFARPVRLDPAARAERRAELGIPPPKPRARERRARGKPAAEDRHAGRGGARPASDGPGRRGRRSS